MPRNSKNGGYVTVSGFLEKFLSAKDRPGCVLHMRSGDSRGRYYVPLSPHDCRRAFPEQTRVRFRIWCSQKPDSEGIYDTAGPEDRFWEVSGA